MPIFFCQLLANWQKKSFKLRNNFYKNFFCHNLAILGGSNCQFIGKKNLYCIFNKILIKISNFLFLPINWQLAKSGLAFLGMVPYISFNHMLQGFSLDIKVLLLLPSTNIESISSVLITSIYIIIYLFGVSINNIYQIAFLWFSFMTFFISYTKI